MLQHVLQVCPSAQRTLGDHEIGRSLLQQETPSPPKREAEMLGCIISPISQEHVVLRRMRMKPRCITAAGYSAVGPLCLLLYLPCMDHRA